MRSITLKGKTIFNCRECSANKEYPNKLLSFLPPVHRCFDTFDGSDVNGVIILNPNGIPDWCPHLRTVLEK
jgi:hypothetical protein